MFEKMVLSNLRQSIPINFYVDRKPSLAKKLYAFEKLI